mmetsp:Transcript_31671/g.82933  ORF Transcript_31671/g.82933 Transcript_31671/m.82933 type:complete len:360 (+) Transcript_31671:55-1134(+)
MYEPVSPLGWGGWRAIGDGGGGEGNRPIPQVKSLGRDRRLRHGRGHLRERQLFVVRSLRRELGGGQPRVNVLVRHRPFGFHLQQDLRNLATGLHARSDNAPSNFGLGLKLADKLCRRERLGLELGGLTGPGVPLKVGLFLIHLGLPYFGAMHLGGRSEPRAIPRVAARGPNGGKRRSLADRSLQAGPSPLVTNHVTFGVKNTHVALHPPAVHGASAGRLGGCRTDPGGRVRLVGVRDPRRVLGRREYVGAEVAEVNHLPPPLVVLELHRPGGWQCARCDHMHSGPTTLGHRRVRLAKPGRREEQVELEADTFGIKSVAVLRRGAYNVGGQGVAPQRLQPKSGGLAELSLRGRRRWDRCP